MLLGDFFDQMRVLDESTHGVISALLHSGRPDGLVGSVGSVGLVGSVGSVGFVGSVGSVGLVGSVGSVGFVGSVGSVGLVGSVGSVGFVGSVGSVGFVGSVGSVGFVGSVGSVGFVGSVGSAVGSVVGSVGVSGSVSPVVSEFPLGIVSVVSSFPKYSSSSGTHAETNKRDKIKTAIICNFFIIDLIKQTKTNNYKEKVLKINDKY